MCGRIHRWLASLLTASLACGLPVAALGQFDPTLPGDPTWMDPAYTMAGQAVAADNQFVSNFSAEKDKDLATRVKDLEAALKKIKDKEAADKKKAAAAMSVKPIGRIFIDQVFFGQNAASRAAPPVGLGDAQDTTFFRAARLGIEGTGFDVAYYRVEMDFTGRSTLSLSDPPGGTVTAGQVLWKNVYLGISDLPLVGKAQVGHFKEPISLEEMTSARYITFMERGLPNALLPGFNTGAMITNHTESENATFATGIFRSLPDNPPLLAADNANWAWTTRVTFLPWYDECTEAGLLHLGFGYSYRDTTNTAGLGNLGSTLTLLARPEVGQGPYVVNSSITAVTNYHIFGPEIAFVYGPFSIQSEYIGALFNRTGAGVEDAYLSGAYVFVSYFLTGESRSYKRTSGYFDRVRPHENFFRVRTEDGYVETGRGAWEVGYRYSYLDGRDAGAGIVDGYASDHTFGVNWYLNPYMRLMFNYVHSDTAQTGGAPYIDCFMMRAQIDF